MLLFKHCLPVRQAGFVKILNDNPAILNPEVSGAASSCPKITYNPETSGLIIHFKTLSKMKPENKNFFQKVYEVAEKIPYGRVTSYGAIAKYLGAARSARMVGWAMNGAGSLENVPAHRVVNKAGLLTGKHHFDGTNLMQQLLESEGIKVVDNQIVDLEKHFWDPFKELG
ncbi:Methylated-DNA-[protein]-cysteine S-methyltransferase [hydrothermal vent metagenome]|uniref:Methylated-DNA-[protein]-cysteine S-methyltransferase n=1 Tax=hydrothermal vent metagenome TaxID=652676 RepID=A0A3B0UGN3_9ZZZZ